MDFRYIVLLKPSNIRFTSNTIPDRFDNRIELEETLEQLRNGEIRVDDIPKMQVVWSEEHWDWYTLNNRRLWVLQELEKEGLCRLIKTHRLEDVRSHPKILYGSVKVIKREQTLRREFREMSVTSSRCSSPEKTLQGKGDFEFRAKTVHVKIERNIISDEGGHQTCHETRLCRYSEVKESRYETPRRSSQRNTPRKCSTLARHVPSCERFNARAQELQRYRSYKTHGRRGRIYGIVSYGFWRQKRKEYFDKFYTARYGRLAAKHLPDVLHTCGVCYKSFRRRVSLEQHSEELLHYACVPCGKFFTSSTALGQHKNALEHYLPQ